MKTLETPKTPGALMNDVVVAGGHAYFTDSFRPVFYRAAAGKTIGELEPWLDFTGTPLAYDKGVNLNGIAATPDGKTLLVVQMNKGLLFKIDIATKKVTAIDLKGETVPSRRFGAERLHRLRRAPAGRRDRHHRHEQGPDCGRGEEPFHRPGVRLSRHRGGGRQSAPWWSTPSSTSAGGATTPFAVLAVPLATLNPKK